MPPRYPGLGLEGNTYIVRKAVPADLRVVIGKRELIRSLKTGDISEARRAWEPMWREFNRIIADARRGAAPKPVIDRRMGQMALAQWGVLEQGKPLPADEALHTPWLITDKIAKLERAVSSTEGWRDISGFDQTVADMLAAGGLVVAPSDPMVEVMRGEAAITLLYAEKWKERARLEVAFQRRADAVRKTDLDDVAVEPTQPAKALPAASLTIQRLFDAWLPTLTVAEKEKGRLKHQIRRLIEFVGDKPASHVEKREILEFMDLVARFPGRKRPPALNALPISKLIERFEIENAARPEAERWKTLTRTTAEEWFAGYSRMWEFGLAMEFDNLVRNPFHGLRFAIRGAPSTKRRAYTDDEITTIFTSPMYQGFDGDPDKGYRDRPGSKIVRDAKYWLPILALFHGGRLSEIAAMPLADFKSKKAEDEQVHYFDLTDRSLKTDKSERIVPLHPHMVGIGWLDYVAERRTAGDRWLFPDLDHANKNGPGHEFSKWWGNWCNAHGLADPGLVYHSWRHTWKRRARQSPVKREMHDIISGHAGVAVADNYGKGADIEALARDMALITFPKFPKLPAPTTTSPSPTS
jgi:hypothetical protein